MKEFVLSTKVERVLAYKFNMQGARKLLISVAIPEYCADLIESQMKDIKLSSNTVGNERFYPQSQGGGIWVNVEGDSLCIYVESSVAEIKEI